jgi:hypothetical protein
MCPSLLLTGLYCPGCGSLRAIHDTLTGNVAEAFSHNVLLVPGLVFVLWWWVSQLAAAYGRRIPAPPTSSRFAVVVLAVFVVFAVLRNLPGSALAP